ncbi:lamin tail domain-containing protein [Geoglobus acetivorans]|uniref:Lamin tail domain-containing protein n=1 Tax=Geoglobus acetivorans TaxID=565033 RepID=A0ABZ3H2G8_GEOAI|nr:lamin tail domain-containing protein [Geoglobus acetivorans]
MRKFVLITILLALLFAGCSGEVEEVGPTPTPTPTVTPMHSPTSTPTPAMTPTPMMTNTPMETPQATPSPTPMQPTTTPTPFEFEYGVKYKVLVVDVIDGDTIDVKLPDGTVERVRMLGVDTPETTASKNKAGEYGDITDLECLAQWGQNAKQFTQKLYGKYVWIEFDSLAGMRGYYGRLLTYVYYPDENTDFTAELVKQGYARVYVEGTFEKESEYVSYQDSAISNGVGLWGACAVTTPTPAPTETSTSGTCVYILNVNYDAPGNDNENPNGEYVVLKNSCSSSVNLAGWVLEDDAGHKYVFPPYTMNSGETLYIYSGNGVDSTGKLYWGYGRAIWNNGGDTAYLYDSTGNLVDSYSW